MDNRNILMVVLICIEYKVNVVYLMKLNKLNNKKSLLTKNGDKRK